MNEKQMVKQLIKDAPEYSFLREDERLGGNIVLLGYGGSHAYGTNIASSDIDLRGIATRSAKDICISEDFEEVVNSPTDTVVYSLDKMIRLLAQCNPNCIEILGLKPEHYFEMGLAGEMLLDNKGLFLSKRCVQTFGGYATQQLYRLQQKTLTALAPEEYNSHIAKVVNQMKEHLQNSYGFSGITMNEKGGKLFVDFDTMKDVPIDTAYGLLNEVCGVVREYNKNSTRNNKAIEHGKINKHAMHLIRLYMMAIDILEKKEIITYRADEHDLLMSIRNGDFCENGQMNKDFFDLLREYEIRFEEAKRVSTLPDIPDMKKINDLHCEINKSVISQSLDKPLQHSEESPKMKRERDSENYLI